MKTNAICIGTNEDLSQKINDQSEHIHVALMTQPLAALKKKNEIGLIIVEEWQNQESATELVKFLKENLSDAKVVLFVICDKVNNVNYMKAGADDVFSFDTPVGDIDKRFIFLQKYHADLKIKKKEVLPLYKIPAWKRVFDIVFASLAILFLSPLFIIIALLIRIESKGKVFYASKRVGTGYKFFNFYKFRSMYSDADKKVDALMMKNQYADNDEKTAESEENQKPNQDNPLLLSDEENINEQQFLQGKRKKQETSFFKLSNDPRITKTGRLIRNTSIDELPQLFNILKGDMSVVGNRPLPLYEAELLTSDRWAERFLAPAGLTGLWQVTKRGGANKMSADERKQLDIDYAENFTFFGDLKIILMTIPAMLQHENV